MQLHRRHIIGLLCGLLLGCSASPSTGAPRGPIEFKAPGLLEDGKGKAKAFPAAWDLTIRRWLNRHNDNEMHEWFVGHPPLTQMINQAVEKIPADAPVAPVIWTAFPNRLYVAHPSVDRRTLWRYADSGPPGLDHDPPGPRGWQDEYVEWAVTRNDAGRITRISMTSESREYFYALWDHDPEAVLAIYRETVGPAVKLEDLYLLGDDGKPIVDPHTGRPAYNDLNDWNTRTSGGLAHMIGPFNYLVGAMGLSMQSTVLRRDEAGAPIVDPGALLSCAQHGTHGRFSDPFISALANDLVRGPGSTPKGVRLGLAMPLGIYIQAPNFAMFGLPPQAPKGAKPSDYWRVVRGYARKPGEPIDRIVHAVFEVPEAQGFTVSDITLNGVPIEYGAQLMEYLSVGIGAVALPQVGPPQVEACATGDGAGPFAVAMAANEDLLEVIARSQLPMYVHQGTSLDTVALQVRNATKDVKVQVVDGDGVEAKVTGVRDTGDGTFILSMTVSVSPDAAPGDRGIKLVVGDKTLRRGGMLAILPK